MTELIIIGGAALVASLLTFFTGFGVGTILLPVFSVFFPVETAVAMTAIVHFLNNGFKALLIGGHLSKMVVIRFGIAAAAGAFIGAQLLFLLSETEALITYELWGQVRQITPGKLVIALLIIIFALFDLLPALERLQFGRKFLVPGGVASGFFGGLSGHQGALRSAFLIKAGLSKESFIATGVMISVFVDVTRISVYFTKLPEKVFSENMVVLATACLAAFAGAAGGRVLLKKITFDLVKKIVGAGILALGLAMGAGII